MFGKKVKSMFFSAAILLSLFIPIMNMTAVSEVYAAAAIAFSERSLTLDIDEDGTLYVEDYGSYSKDPTYSFSCSNKKVVSIYPGSYGSVEYEAVSPGEATISVKSSTGATASCRVKVLAPPLTFSERSIQIEAGDDDLELSVDDPQYGRNYQFTSSNTNVLKIVGYSDYGSCDLIPVSNGTATVKVSDKYGSSATCTVKVKIPVMKLNPQRITTFAGDEETGIEIENYRENIKYTAVNSNKQVVSLADEGDGNYTITPLQVGTAKITVTDAYGQKDTCTVNVEQRKMRFSESRVTMRNLDTDYTLYLENTDTDTCTYTFTQSSNILTIDDNGDGSITINPKKAGSTTVTAKDQYGASCSCTVTVTRVPVTLGVSNVSVVKGRVTVMDVTDYDAENTYKVTTGDKNVATASINDDGVVRIKGVGTKNSISASTVISVSDRFGTTAKCTVIVYSDKAYPTASSITIKNSKSTMKIGNKNSHAVFKSVSSTKKKVATATVSGNSVVINPAGAGKCTLKIKDAGGYTHKVKVTIKASYFALNLNKKSIKIAKLKDDGTIINTNNAVSIAKAKSSNKKIAKVKVKGQKVIVTPVKPGKTTITITDSKKKRHKVKVTIKKKYFNQIKAKDQLSKSVVFDPTAKRKEIKGKTAPKAAASVKIGSKTYKATANKNGSFTIKTPSLTKGKKYTVVLKKSGLSSKHKVTVK